MATINELAQLVAEPLNRPLDASFVAMVKDRVKIWRSRLLKNTLDKTPADRKFFTQSLTLPLEEVDAAACNLPLSCKVWRTVSKIPNPVRANSILFDFVGSVDHINPFKLTKRWELPYMLANTYMPKVTNFYHYEDDRIISNVPYITLEYIADDPEAVMELQCGGVDCDVENEEYPISGELAQLIVQSILQVDFNYKPQVEKEDETVPVK